MGIFTAMFLNQYFCLHSILLFFKSYSEIETTLLTAKFRGRKSFDTWYHIVTFATLGVRFSSKSKGIIFFPKRDQSIQAIKKLFCYVIVKNYLCNVWWTFLIKIESTWRCEIKEQAPQLTLLHLGRTVRSSHRRCCIRKNYS